MLKSNIKALLVEDNKEHIDMIIDLLYESELIKVSMDIAENLANTRQLMQKNLYDIILADLSLPDSRYDITLKELIKYFEDTPIIVITSLDNRDTIYGIINEGASDCIPKSQLSTPMLERSIIYSIDRHKKDQVIKQKVSEIEKDLRNSEARFRTIVDDVLDHSMVGVFILDEDYKVVWINRILEQYFGLNRGNIIGKDKRQTIRSKIKDIFDDPEGFMEKVFATYDDNTYLESFECHVLPEGEREERWLLHQSMPIRSGLYKGGRVEFYHDITERKRTEERMTSLANILEESLNEIYIFDAKTLRFIQVNKGARLNLGFSLEELRCLTPPDLEPEFTHESFMKIIEPLRVGENKKIEFTTVHQRKDGSLYDVEVHLQLSTFQSVPVFVAIILDITERKKMEGALIQSEKLKSIGTITAGISHEFNNILAIISGNVQLLEGTYKKHGDLTDRLRIIESAIDDGAGISRNMLEFTKTSQDAKEFVSSDIGDLIMQAIDFTMPRWKNEAQARGIDYQIDTEGMERVSSILCNPAELREVFINLIINALDAMPEGGSLSFSTWSGDGTVFVSTSDTGEGMSEEVRKYIFDPFFTTKSPVGTGLGMSITYGIITRHGGKIEAESEVGMGSTFTLQFPSTIKTASPIATPKPEQEAKVKNLSILVVDDEEAICNMLDKFLSKRGNKVKAVDNGADAIELVNSEYFDVVLCDLAMPNVSGYDVIKVLNKLEKRPKTGIITGWGEQLKPIEEEGIKVDFVLKKPFDLSELTRHINEVCEKGSTDTEAS